MAGHEGRLVRPAQDFAGNSLRSAVYRLEQDHNSNVFVPPGQERGADHTAAGEGYLYYPTLSQSQCQIEQSRSFLHRVYDGSLSKMVLGFVESGSLSPEELEELKALIDRQEKNDAAH